MELQSVATGLVETARTTAAVDVPTVILKDIRAEAARITLSKPVTKAAAEEVLVPDQRADLSPAQSVEKKLSAMLRGGAAAIPVSHFRLAKLCRKA
ncbi:MAG TPA: hypothetical protein VGF55_13550 [Gemmataceae bacterium]|jgi:hypothetical protein